jgi:hypothetical protein
MQPVNAESVLSPCSPDIDQQDSERKEVTSEHIKVLFPRTKFG